MYKLTAQQILDITDAVDEYFWIASYASTNVVVSQEKEIACIQYVLENGYSTKEEIIFNVKEYKNYVESI